jgi:hypothetical protein
VASRNAIKSGAYALQVVLPGEDATAFDELEQSLQADFNPRTRLEVALVHDVAVLL